MKRITEVFKYLMKPDAQEQSWYAWATNQMSHAFLGALIAVFAGAYWLITTLGVAVAKEGFDLYKLFTWPSLSDSLTDILFWVGGAGVVAGGDYRYWFVLGLFVLLAAGIYFRIKRK
jgi:hypothetical protein